MSEILSADEWEHWFAILCRSEEGAAVFTAEERCRSHERALRVRLAEVEAERDQWHTEAQHWSSRPQEEAARARSAGVLNVERNYWQTRSHLARTRTEEVMAEWHLDLIDAALAVLGEGEIVVTEPCPDKNPEGERCPTCGSPERSMNGAKYDVVGRLLWACHDPWHREQKNTNNDQEESP